MNLSLLGLTQAASLSMAREKARTLVVETMRRPILMESAGNGHPGVRIFAFAGGPRVETQ